MNFLYSLAKHVIETCKAEVWVCITKSVQTRMIEDSDKGGAQLVRLVRMS